MADLAYSGALKRAAHFAFRAHAPGIHDGLNDIERTFALGPPLR